MGLGEYGNWELGTRGLAQQWGQRDRGRGCPCHVSYPRTYSYLHLHRYRHRYRHRHRLDIDQAGGELGPSGHMH
jgi:hypothetical protein